MPRFLCSREPNPVTIGVPVKMGTGKKAPIRIVNLTILPGRNPRPVKGEQRIHFDFELFEKAKDMPQIRRRFDQGKFYWREEADGQEPGRSKHEGLIGEIHDDDDLGENLEIDLGKAV